MDKPIRVLHILQRMEAGGTQALLMNIYRNIDRSKIQFDFLVEYPDKQFYDEEIIKLGGKVYYTSVRKNFNIIKFKKQLKQVIQENDYKVVHVHAFTIGYFALKVAKKCGVPVRIAHSHSNGHIKDVKYYPKLIMQKLYTINATDLFACSESAGKFLYKNKKFNILNNSIDSKKFIYNEKYRNDIRKELNLENNFVVGHVGRLHMQKNHDFLLKVFKEIKLEKENAKLILIGEGPLKDDIEKKVINLGLQDDVIFLGVRNDVNKVLMAMDVFVFPSVVEGLGIVAIESQAAGTPIIMSEIVPDMSVVSPLCIKKSLSDSPKDWAEKSIELANHELAHTNTQKYIIDSGFDLNKTINWIQDYYIKSYKK